MQARRCLDESAGEAWQIGYDPSPNDPVWRRIAAQTFCSPGKS